MLKVASSHELHCVQHAVAVRDPALQRTMGCLACHNGTRVLVPVPAASQSTP